MAEELRDAIGEVMDRLARTAKGDGLSKEEFVREMRGQLIHQAAQVLGLFKRVPELLKMRGWPLDEALQGVLVAAVALTKIKAGGTCFGRPAAADGCGGLWPAEEPSRSARQIVHQMDLTRLLEHA